MRALPVTGSEIKKARKARALSQQEAARRLGVTQGYLSMLESDQRPVPNHLAKRLRQVYGLSLTALPLSQRWNKQPMDENRLAAQLAAAGYPGFSYLSGRTNRNPAELLLSALAHDELDPRIAESLPWLVFTYHDLDWDWVMREAKIHDLTNRLGFTVTLARELAQEQGKLDIAPALAKVEGQLERSRLMREETFCHESMTEAERRWLRQRITPEARRWNLLSDLSVEHLSHVSA